MNGKEGGWIRWVGGTMDGRDDEWKGRWMGERMNEREDRWVRGWLTGWED